MLSNKCSWFFTSRRLVQQQAYLNHSMIFRSPSQNMMMDQSIVDKVLQDKIENEQEYKVMTMVEDDGQTYDLKGRNSKYPKKSNHGARPCSSVMRKLKKKGYFKKITAF